MRNACSRAADEFAVQDCRRCRAAYNGDFLCAIGEDLRRSGPKALRDAGDRARDAHWAILFRDIHAGLYDNDPIMAHLRNGADGEPDEQRERAFKALRGFLATVSEGLAEAAETAEAGRPALS